MLLGRALERLSREGSARTKGLCREGLARRASRSRENTCRVPRVDFLHEQGEGMPCPPGLRKQSLSRRAISGHSAEPSQSRSSSRSSGGQRMLQPDLMCTDRTLTHIPVPSPSRWHTGHRRSPTWTKRGKRWRGRGRRSGSPLHPSGPPFPGPKALGFIVTEEHAFVSDGATPSPLVPPPGKLTLRPFWPHSLVGSWGVLSF